MILNLKIGRRYIVNIYTGIVSIINRGLKQAIADSTFLAAWLYCIHDNACIPNLHIALFD